MDLRPYQVEAVQNVRNGWMDWQRQLLVLPTGGGKTICFAELCKLNSGRTLVLAHREELVDQAIAKIHTHTGIRAGKEKAEWSADHGDKVVVASVQTMMRRLDRWPANHFNLVICDEAHHAISQSWQTVLQHFAQSNVLGVTATPDRGDKKELGGYFENVAFEISMFDLIRQGYLSPIAVKSIPIQVDISNVKSTAGDIDAGQLGGALMPYLHPIARSIRDNALTRRVLVFLPLRATSRAFVEACKMAGLTAEHVDGESEDRKEILERFARDEFQVLCNAMLLTEGFDDPGIDCVVVLRPTKSRSLYSQMVGRGTRLAPGKENLLLLDYLWHHEKHKLCRPASLVATSDSEAFEATQLSFKPGGGEQDLEELVQDAREQREEALKKQLEEKAKRKAKFINPDEFAMLAGGDSETIDYQPSFKWEREDLSDAQKDMLTKNGFDVTEIRGRGHASKIISLMMKRQDLKLCTPKQMRMLKRFGVPNAENISFVQASQILDHRMKRKETVTA